MNYKNDIFYEAPYYKMVQKKMLYTNENYDRFINWVSGEFDLQIQEESLGLTVYFPNGWFSIKRIFSKKKEFVEIIAINKSQTACEKIFSQVLCLYSHLNRIETKNSIH